jgi:hypothetical protein
MILVYGFTFSTSEHEFDLNVAIQQMFCVENGD